MKKQLLLGIGLTLTLSTFLQAQSFTGSYQMVGVKVSYTNVARVAESADDSLDSYFLMGIWPSNAAPLLSAPLAGWAPGDTIAVVETPDILLIEAGLAGAGINLNVGLNQESGVLLIPGIEGSTTTYPTTDTEDCSTFAVIAPVTDNAGISYSSNSNSYDSEEGTFTWGFGISESTVFDWFDAPEEWDEPDGDNYGLLIGYFNEDNTGLDGADVIWHAVDGQDSDSGIDDAGILNRHLGVTLAPADTVTVAALNAAGMSFNVGTHPILGGTGVDLDGDGENDGVVNTDWGYLFDPIGDDGVMLSGDEAYQFTGYYLTYNFIAAANVFADIITAEFVDNLVDTDGDGYGDTPNIVLHYVLLGQDENTALVSAADSLAGLAASNLYYAFGGTDATMAGIVSATASSTASTTLGALLPSVGAGTMTLTEALTATGQTTAVATLGALGAVGITVDDSDHDYDGTNGRLVIQIGNSCVPDIQTRDVYAMFDAVDTDASVVSDDILPVKFAVHNNYPNPFNPSTQISFDLIENSATEVSVWNLLGQKITTLFSGELNAGRHTVTFNGKDVNGNTLPSGVYIYRVEAGNNVSTKKMMLLK